jgi:hypothetical protein
MLASPEHWLLGRSWVKILTIFGCAKIGGSSIKPTHPLVWISLLALFSCTVKALGQGRSIATPYAYMAAPIHDGLKFALPDPTLLRRKRPGLGDISRQERQGRKVTGLGPCS